MSSKDRELKFDKSVMYEVLKQCMVASIVDKGLTKQADLYPLVVKTIAYKCGYVANVLRSIRHAISRLHTRQKEIKTGEQYITLTQSGAWSTYGSVSVSQLSISIVGCGIVGTELLENLVNSRLFHPTCFVVSTRQPNTLSTYSKMGLNVCFNNTLAGSHADVLFLCCSPNHFADVSPSLRGNLKPSTIVVSTLLGVTKERLCSVLNHPHCMTVSVDIPGISPLPSLPKHDNAQLVKASCPFITPDDYLTFTSLLLPAIPSSLPSPLLFSAILASTLNTPTAALLISHVLTTPPVKKEQGLGKFGGLAAFEALLEGTLQEHAAKRHHTTGSMALTKEAIENLTEAVKHVQQASEEGILYAMMSVPGMGSPGYGVTVMKKGRVAEGEGMEGAGQPCDREWLLNKDVLKACGQYMDVYSLARARGVCREFYHDFQPQAGHKPFYVATVDACLRDVYGLGAPSLSVMALAGRTASSRRYIITTYSSPTHNPLQKMYFVSSAPGVVRELRAAIASCDPTAPICTIAIDNLPIDTARGKLARAAYDNHALDRFWDWCHPDLHDQYKPTLSIC